MRITIDKEAARNYNVNENEEEKKNQVEENNKKPETETDTTITKQTELPKTGSKYTLIAIMIGLIITIYVYRKNKFFKDIK